ncbi:MAG: hypothetical protein KGV44_04910 [Flavobacteriaceae bacterium]|nr:hypothetical protein [Flavobacteriaceae bacterium]
MKINLVPTIIALAISSLIAYGFFAFCNNEHQLLVSIGSFVFLFFTIEMTIGVSFDLPRTTTNIRVVSGVFFVIALISNIIFSFLDFLEPSYIITNGILLLIFILIVYAIYKAKQ